MRCPTLAELPPPLPGKAGWPWTEESLQLPDLMPTGEPWPKVSVVTPSYNQGRFVEETVRSVLLQGYPNLEYIIVDGGSTDGSTDIIRKYEPWLAYWVSKPDRGQTYAINKGWRRATGDVLAYINSDDCYLNGSVAAAAEAFSANPGAGLIYGTATIVDEDSRPIRAWQAYPFDLKRMFTKTNSVPQPAAFFSRTALETVGSLDEQWDMIMDYEFVIRVGMRFPTVCLSRTLALFRDHPHSKTSTMFERANREVMRFGASFLAKHAAEPEVMPMKRATTAYYFYTWSVIYAKRGRHHSHRSLKPLILSLRAYPGVALRRPLDTAYLIKEALLSYVATSKRVNTKLAS